MLINLGALGALSNNYVYAFWLNYLAEQLPDCRITDIDKSITAGQLFFVT